nr:fruit SANT/MYB Binding protein1 isoform X1 [Ipomoea batatas]
MAAESNMGFHQQQAWSFQSGVSSEMIPIGNFYGHLGVNVNVNNSNSASGLSGGGGGVLFSGNPNIITNSNNNPGISQAGTSSPSFLIDTVPGLKHDTGLAVEWSVEEQYKLEEGLIKFSSEPSIMKYIKIAATLREKTVRDVALRCRWMTDKAAESSLKNSTTSASPLNLAAYSLAVNHRDRSNCMNSGAESFYRTYFYLCRMSNMPGIMSQMPPLPVFLDEELASSLLPNSTQAFFRLLYTTQVGSRGIKNTLDNLILEAEISAVPDTEPKHWIITASLSVERLTFTSWEVISSSALAAICTSFSACTANCSSKPSLFPSATVTPLLSSVIVSSECSDSFKVLTSEGTGSLTSEGTGSLTSEGTGSLTSEGTGSLTSEGTGSLTSEGTGSITSEGPDSLTFGAVFRTGTLLITFFLTKVLTVLGVADDPSC